MLSFARNHSHLFAGLIFTIVGLIVLSVALFLNNNPRPLAPFEFSIIVLLPMTVSGLCGALLGSDIFDSSKIKTSLRAALHGTLIVLLSFIVWDVLISIIIPVLYAGESGASIFLTFLIYGMLSVGWLMAILGTVAGWLIHILSKKAA